MLVGRFRLQKAWDKFTFSIVKNYIESNKKAEKFHHQNLKFKTLFGFKEVISLRNKTHKTIIFVNANMPIRRWRRNYKVRQFLETRNFLILAKVFRYLKLRLLLQNKEWNLIFLFFAFFAFRNWRYFIKLYLNFYFQQQWIKEWEIRKMESE